MICCITLFLLPLTQWNHAKRNHACSFIFIVKFEVRGILIKVVTRGQTFTPTL
ncbi:hypothetical protein GLYMA_08G044550v4 [Glycine max]|nr:hypothetical protein GLYMA_08G044550v4 [Glycine max]KAH1049616.1 hypothetical protein GYH30_020228 [Glycine max]